MKTMKQKALDLLQFAIERTYLDRPLPELPTEPQDEDTTVWDLTADLMATHTVDPVRVRHDMARELVALRQRVVRHVTRDGIPLQYVTTAAARELRKLSQHPACRRVSLCTKCAAAADEAKQARPLACRCPSVTQRWIWKFLRQSEHQTRVYQWHIVYVLLVVRDIVEHWRENRLEVESARDAVPRLQIELDREQQSMTRREAVEYDEYDGDGEFVQRHKFTPSDGTSRLATDLRGWDRPSSMGRRTQRLAFCPECMHRDDPWFLVARSKPFGEAECPRCGTTEVQAPPKDPNAKRPTYRVTRYRRVHGERVPVIHEFYRSRGRWYSERTNEQVHLMLNHQLERRWLARIKTA